MVLPEAGTYPPNSTSKRHGNGRVRFVEIATFMSNDRGWRGHVGTATRIWKANKKPFKEVELGGVYTYVESFDMHECKRVSLAGELASVLRKLVKDTKNEMVSKRRTREIFVSPFDPDKEILHEIMEMVWTTTDGQKQKLEMGHNLGRILSDIVESLGKMKQLQINMTVIKPVMGQHRRGPNGTWIRDQEAIRRMAERQWTIGTQNAREDWTTPSVISVKKPSLTTLPMVPKQWPKFGEKCPYEDCEKSFATPSAWMKHWNSTHLLEETP